MSVMKRLATKKTGKGSTATAEKPEIVVKFNGIFTVTNTATGEWRTFRIRTQKDDALFAPGKRLVSILDGPDNGNCYSGFGFAYDDNLVVWKSKRGEDKILSAFDYYADMLKHFFSLKSKIDWTARGYVILMENQCRRCNRRLTTPESIKSGIGPVCAGR